MSVRCPGTGPNRDAVIPAPSTAPFQKFPSEFCHSNRSTTMARWPGLDRHCEQLPGSLQDGWRVQDYLGSGRKIERGVDNKLLDPPGMKHAIVTRLVYAGGARSSFAVEPVIEKVSARGHHHASQLWGLGVRVSRGLKKGLDLTLGASVHVKRHGGADPLFGTRRVDRNLQVSVRLLYRSVRLIGFAPYFGYSLERNRSTIPVREYRTQGVVAGISRAL